MDSSLSALKDFQLSNSTEEKLKPETGLRIAKTIANTARGGNSGYYFARNARFKKNRDWASGRLNVQAMFGDRMQMNGKINYMNLKWSCLHVVNTIISRLVGRWMTQKEKCQVQAVDNTSAEAKKRAIEEAEFAVENKEMVQALQQQSGTPIVKQDLQEIEDKDDLEVWKAEFSQLPEEIEYEMGVNKVFSENGWFDVIKERVLHDSAEVGLVGGYVYMDNKGEIITEYIKPEDAIMSYSEFPDFRDTSWRGRMKALKITELRDKYGIQNGGTLTEEQIFKLAQTSKDYQLVDKLTFLWNNSWNYSFYRPYDDWNIDIMCFEIRTLDKDVYSVKTSKAGTKIVKKNSYPIPEDAKKITKEKWNIYQGVYAIADDMMLSWGLKENMIRPQDPKEIGNAEFSYCYYMYQNKDMRNLAVPEKIEDAVGQMILARLKIQQLVAVAAPPGTSVDVDAMQEIDLGLGGSSQPIDVLKNYIQTGRLYYRGRDADGNPIHEPIKELANAGFWPQMQAYMELYRYNYQVLKDELGEDPNLMQQAAQPRVANSNIEVSIEQANNATGYMYLAYIRLMEDMAKKISCLLNDSVTVGASIYRSILKEEKVKGRNFSTKFKILPNQLEIDKLEQRMNAALQTNPDLILYLNPSKIVRVAKEDVKLAEILFERAQKKCVRSQKEQAAQNAKMNADAQVQSLQVGADNDKQLEGMKGAQKQKEIVLQGTYDLLKNQIPIPANLQALLNGVLTGMGIPIAMENQQMMAAAQQQMQQEQQPEQQQTQEQQPEMAA